MTYQIQFMILRRRSRPIMSALSALMIAVTFAFVFSVAARAQATNIATYDDGLPFGLFAFDGNTNTVAVTTTVIAFNEPLAVPNQLAQNGVLAVDYAIADFGGITHPFESPQNWLNNAGLSFWFRGTNSGLNYQVEIFDNRSDVATDTAERFEYRFTDMIDDWNHFTIPFSAFSRATDYQPVGAPNDGLNLTNVWGYSIVLPQGSATVYVDSVALTDDILLADYENGQPLGNFIYSGAASTVNADIVSVNGSSPLAMSGQVGSNDLLKLTFDVQDYSGIGRTFEPVPQDWRDYEGVGFWFYGSNTRERFQIELYDNRVDGSAESERYEYRFDDAFIGWQEFRIPFTAFVRSTDFQPIGVPDDGLTLSAIWGYDIVLPQTSTTVYIDELALLSDAPDDISDSAGVVIRFDSSFPDGYYDFRGPDSTLIITTTVLPADDVAQIPGQIGDMTVLSVDYNITDYGGFAIAPNSEPQDWRNRTGIGFWFHGGNSGGTFQVEIFDNRSDPATDTSERFEYRFVDDFSGWRKINVAFDDFFRSSDFQPEGAPDDGLNLSEVWGYGFIMPPTSGAVSISELSLVNEAPIETFDGADFPSGYYQFSDDTDITDGQLIVVPADGPNARPLQDENNGILIVNFDVASYGGFAVKYPNMAENWSLYKGISFWLRGNNAGDRIQFELFDNRSAPTADDAERYEYRITDHGPTWRKISIPFTDFVRAVDFQPATAPNDGLNLTEIWGFEFVLPQSSGTVMIDQMSVFNGTGEIGFTVKSSVYLPTITR